MTRTEREARAVRRRLQSHLAVSASLAEVKRAKDASLAPAREAGTPIPEPRYRPAIYAR